MIMIPVKMTMINLKKNNNYNYYENNTLIGYYTNNE